MSRVYDEQTQERICAMLRKGTYTRREIAARFGINTKTVTRIGYEHGIQGAFRQWSEEDDAILRSEYETKGARGLVPQLRRSYSSIAHRAKVLGLKTRVGPYGKLRRPDVEG